jgi:hypothetical protein
MMIKIRARSIATAVLLVAALAGMAACSREQQDWRAAEGADTTESYGQFIERHPDSELVKEARARVAQLGEDLAWREAAKTDTADAYLQFLAKHPTGKWTQEARIRAQNFALAATTQREPAAAVAAPGRAASDSNAPPAGAVPASNASPTAAPASPAPASSAPPLSAASPAPASSAPALPTASPAPASSVPAVAATRAVSAAGAVLTSTAATVPGAYGIQLGAFTSEDRANAEWRALQGRFAEQLQGLAPQVVSAETASGRVFRLQARAGDESRARLICEQLKQHAQGCVPVVPH